jgi:hypothetical protein
VHVHGQVLAAAERAADPGQRQPDPLRRQPERGADLPLVDVQPLGRHVQVDTARAVRDGHPGLRPEECLVLHPHRVLAGDDDLGGRLGITLADLEVPDQVAAFVQPRRTGAQRRPRVGDRLEDVVAHRDLLRGPAGDLRVVGCYQGDWLALVADHAGGQHRLIGALEPADVSAGDILVGQHGVDAGGGQRRADLDASDPGVRMRAAQRDPPQHALHPQVAAVGELAGHLQRAVRPGRAGADPAGRCLAVGRHARPGWRGHDTSPALRSSALLAALAAFAVASSSTVWT